MCRPHPQLSPDTLSSFSSLNANQICAQEHIQSWYPDVVKAEEHDDQDDNVDHEPFLPEELLRLLSSGIWLITDSDIIAEQTTDEGNGKQQFNLVFDEKHTTKEYSQKAIKDC